MKDEKLKILMLEDNPGDAELIQRQLAKAGIDCEFRLMMTKDAFEKSLLEFGPDMILSDNDMPQFSASEALRIVQQRNLHIPFIMVTGTVSEEFAAGIIKAGADDYLLKDRLARLPAAIEAALRQKRIEREKKEADDKVKENEKKYRSLVERVSDGFIALDLEWNFVYVNKRAEELFQRPQGSLLGKNMWEEFPEAFDKTFYKAYRKAMETQQNFYLKEYSFAIDKWVESNIYPSATGISVFFRDITEQKKAEIKARQSEERYGMLIDRITDAFIAVDNEFRFTYVNKQAGELLGRDPRLLIGNCVWDEFPTAIGSALYNTCLRAIREQQYVCSTDFFDAPNLWLESHIYPSADGISGFVRDITERKKVEENLRNSELRLNEAQAVAHISNWDINLVKDEHSWSHEFYRIMGLDKDIVEASEETFMSLIHPEDKAYVSNKLAEALQPGSTGYMDYRFIRPDGETRHGYSEWKFEMDGDGKPKRIFGIMQDVTEIRQAAANLKILEQQILEQTIQEQKKIARAIITGQEKERNYIGQELHDNVCQILVGAKLHMGMTAVKESVLKNLIKYPMELIDTSIEEIRVLSHKLVTPVKNIDLEELVRELIYNISISTTLKINFEYALPGDAIDDELKLNIYRIVQELVSNIIKHSGATSINIALEALQRHISLVVLDDGIGFTPDLKIKGIGLANIINRVETFNGTIVINSAPGRGCEINIEIPY